MSDVFRVEAIVPGAGRGTRFTSDGDVRASKIDQDLGGRTVLLRTIETLSRRDEITRIIVAAPPDDIDAFRDRYGATLGFHGVEIVEGGRIERWETVRNALEAISDDATHIAVHDAARPGVDDTLLDRLFAAARELDAVVPAIPIRGTIKRADVTSVTLAGDADDVLADSILGETSRSAVDLHRVVETIDRRGLFEVQTPQVFRAGLLRRAYAAGDLDGVTDDGGAVERLGEPVHLVDGSLTNFKITTPDDLAMMRAVIAGMNNVRI